MEYCNIGVSLPRLFPDKSTIELLGLVEILPVPDKLGQSPGRPPLCH